MKLSKKKKITLAQLLTRHVGNLLTLYTRIVKYADETLALN